MSPGKEIGKGTMAFLSKSMSSWFGANPVRANPELPAGMGDGILPLTDDIFGVYHSILKLRIQH